MAPTIGSPAIRSKTLTVRDVKDPSELCTAAPPCDLHATSLDELLANGKPTVVLFASPGYCSSQTCAPQLGVLLGVRPKYGDAINFHHVEIYKDPRNQVLADAVTEWRLPSEPWIFFVDRNGTIVGAVRRDRDGRGDRGAASRRSRDGRRYSGGRRSSMRVAMMRPSA